MCVNRSGGRLLVAPLRSLSVEVRDTLGHLRQELGLFEAAEALLGDAQRLPDHGRRRREGEDGQD